MTIIHIYERISKAICVFQKNEVVRPSFHQLVSFLGESAINCRANDI